jgi:hypothetical protein
LLHKKSAFQSAARLDNGLRPFTALYSQTYPQIVWTMKKSPLRQVFSFIPVVHRRLSLALRRAGG